MASASSDEYARFTKNEISDSSTDALSLESIRQSLIRQEDTIVLSLIEKTKFPLNSLAYDESSLNIPGFGGSLVQYIVKETEAIQAKVGRYESPEEHPFFPDDLPMSVVTPYNYPQKFTWAIDVNMTRIQVKQGSEVFSDVASPPMKLDFCRTESNLKEKTTVIVENDFIVL